MCACDRWPVEAELFGGLRPPSQRTDQGHSGGTTPHTPRLAAAVAELYAGAPEAFTGRRAALAAAARGAGDRAAAKAIGALRRPTRAAWIVNHLARVDPSAPGKLAELAGALRAAQEARHGPRLRELSAARGALIDALTAQALAMAQVTDPPPSLRLEVSETLTAAIADPDVAAAFATGTLTRAVQWSGFGVLPAGTEADAGSGEDADRARLALSVVPQPRKQDGRTGAGRAVNELAARRNAADEERLAREATELAARRREQYAAAERDLTAASDAAAAAVSAEDRLEAEVRDLEQRLTRARADLAAARMRARHAEAAERRARQAVDRLPRG
jgi:hypothetical protein